jgi:hypothetical protein
VSLKTCNPRVRYGLGGENLERVLSWRRDGWSWAAIAEQIAWPTPTLLFQHYQWAAMAGGYVAEAGCPDLDPAWPDSTGHPRGPVLCESYPRCPCGEGTHRHSADKDGRKVEPAVMDGWDLNRQENP